MSSTECRICFLAFDPKRVPKNLACGHYFCLLCLKNEKASKGCLRCFTCRSVVHVAPDQLVTNFNILSDASSKSEFHCIDCNQEATFTCEKNGHIFKSLAAHKCKQTKSCHEKALEEDKSLRNHETIVNQISKQMNNVLQALLLKSHERRSKNKVFLKKIDDYARGDIRLQEVLCEEETCKASILSLERDLQLLQLNKGLCNISLTSEGSARTATLDLASLATTSPEVLAVIRSLFFLLERDSLLISKQSCNQASRPLNSHAPSQDNTRKGDPEKHAQASVSEQSDDGVLDLEIGQIGFAGPRQMLEEKDTILKCTKIVTELKGLKCDSDPMFSTRLIQKHAPHLESLTLHTIQQEQFNLLASLRSLKHLKLVGHSGRLTARLPLQPDCQLRSLYMTLPIPVQMSLWEAFSPSVVNVTMRIEVASSVDVHLILSRPVKKSTHLRTLHLHRKCVDQHNADECGRQKHLIRRVLPEHVRLSCNMCGVGDGMH